MLNKIGHVVDNAVNKITMYKGMLFSLLFIDAVAIILSYTTDLTGVGGNALLSTTLTLALSCFVSNRLLANLYRASANSDSWLISALIMACLISPSAEPGRLALAALCGVIAMASKYVLIWHTSHIFNPAAFGVAVMSLSGLLPATWWIACPVMLPIVALSVLPTLYRLRKFQMFTVFTLASLLMMLYVQTVVGDTSATEVLRLAFTSWPIVFLGGVMLTEPMTTPARRQTQLLMAVLVGVFFASQLDLGPIGASPHLALLLGNLFTLIVARPYSANLVLRSKRQPTDDVYELTFDKPRGMYYQAGQYMDFTMGHRNADFRGTRRSFSLVSAPHEDELRITFRSFGEQSSSFKRVLAGLEPGGRLRAANPRGDFVLPADASRPLLLIAGGIGITPIRSMVAALVASVQKRDVVLLYTARDEAHFLYRQEFEQAASAGVVSHFELHRVNDEELVSLVPDIAKRHAYISGSDSLIRTYNNQLRRAGVSAAAIHADHFSGY